MKWINNIKIGRRLNFILSLVVLTILSSIGIYIFQKQKSKVLSDSDLRISEQVLDLGNLIEQQIIQNQKLVETSMAFAENYLNHLGQISINRNQRISFNAVNQISKKSTQIQVDQWLLRGKQIQLNEDIVDNIQQKVGGTATIFQRINNGFLRVSTNVLKTNGKRAVGTFIPNSSPVSQAIRGGEAFYGRAFVVNAWYLTVYKPIIINGNVEGILYVGVKEKDLAGLKNIFNEKKYFDSGYPFLIDSKGTFIIHPKKEGENAANEEFFRKILETNQERGRIEYMWEGRKKMLYFEYVESIDSYVAASIYEKELMGIVNNVRNAIFIAVFLGISILILVITLIVRSITAKLQEAVNFSERIANGDLNNSLDIEQKDEIGQLAKALNKMIMHLKDIVTNIKNGADNIAAASQEMSANSQQVSQGASEQASSAEEISSSMQQMSSNIQQNTDNAQQTEKISTKAASDIIEGSSQVNTTVSSMKDIAEKISIIGDIASQTNILALNAAVEAARAGEHGRGFAVVAAEVRKLAERSQKAAGEINEVSKSSVLVAENSGSLLSEIVPDIQKTSKLVEEITAASLEQNSGAEQINNAINQLNQVTQQNAAAAEEMATSSEELSSQADQLRDLIQFFNLDDNSNANTKPQIKKTEVSRKEIKETPKPTKSNDIKPESKGGFKLDMGGQDKTDNEFEEF